jgi:hypothetical protein
VTPCYVGLVADENGLIPVPLQDGNRVLDTVREDKFLEIPRRERFSTSQDNFINNAVSIEKNRTTPFRGFCFQVHSSCLFPRELVVEHAYFQTRILFDDNPANGSYPEPLLPILLERLIDSEAGLYLRGILIDFNRGVFHVVL